MSPKQAKTPNPRTTPAPPKATREVLPFALNTTPPPPGRRAIPDQVFREDVPAHMQLRWSDVRRILDGMLKQNVSDRIASDATHDQVGRAHDLIALKFDERDVALRLLIDRIDKMPDRGAVVAEGEPHAERVK